MAAKKADAKAEGVFVLVNEYGLPMDAHGRGTFDLRLAAKYATAAGARRAATGKDAQVADLSWYGGAR